MATKPTYTTGSLQCPDCEAYLTGSFFCGEADAFSLSLNVQVENHESCKCTSVEDCESLGSLFTSLTPPKQQ